MIKTLPPLQERNSDIDQLSRIIKKILVGFYDEILKQDQDITNSADVLEQALIKGKIIFKDGKFSGEFNRYTSKLLKDMGAIFKRGKYELPAGKLPPRYLAAMAQGMSLNDRQIKTLLNNLMKYSTERIAERKDVIEMSKRVVENINKSVDVEAQRVPTINLQLDDIQRDSIKEKYSENLKLHIKGWADDEILKLRKKVQENYKTGVRYEDLAKDIMKRRDGMSPAKALFIARQETRLLSSMIQEQKFTKGGLQKYVWTVRKDSKVRHDHEDLNGKIFRWDDPPVVDQDTGRRGNPGQDYNCRCYALPVIE